MIEIGVSVTRRRTHVTAIATARPSTTPPAATVTNRNPASPMEKLPDTAAASASR